MYSDASIVKEFRIPLPFSVEEYNIGKLYFVAEASKKETGGGEGLEILQNEPIHPDDDYYKKYGEGQLTEKMIYMSSKLPLHLRFRAPSLPVEIKERSWNCYPFCHTEYSNPTIMRQHFYVHVDTWCKPGNKDIDNVHNLSQEELTKRQIENIDIASDPVSPSDYNKETDPCLFKSEKTGRGPLDKENWQDTQMVPGMTCYKLYRIKFRWWGIQTKTEMAIVKFIRKLLTNSHRELFCQMDCWYGMTIQDIRDLEGKTKDEVKANLQSGETKGTLIKF